MITAICAVGDVAFFMALPHAALNFVWDLALAKLYTNCLMSNLNARADLRGSSQNMSSAAFMNALLESETSTNAQVTPTGLRLGQNVHHIIRSPEVYELENTKTFEASQSQSSHLEVYHANHGVKVTRVVQTLMDPVMQTDTSCKV